MEPSHSVYAGATLAEGVAMVGGTVCAVIWQIGQHGVRGMACC
jgi:hypothetical protein